VGEEGEVDEPESTERTDAADVEDEEEEEEDADLGLVNQLPSIASASNLLMAGVMRHSSGVWSNSDARKICCAGGADFFEGWL
jgi:hypothetical protein